MGGGGKINGKQESSQRVCAWMTRIVLRQRSPKFQLAHWSEKKIFSKFGPSGLWFQNADRKSECDIYFNLKALLLGLIWVMLITFCVFQEMDSVSSVLFPSGELKSQVKPNTNLSLKHTSDKLIISLAIV